MIAYLAYWAGRIGCAIGWHNDAYCRGRRDHFPGGKWTRRWS
jgi:hypothetical protein